MSKICPNCLTEFDDNHGFCSNCGSRLCNKQHPDSNKLIGYDSYSVIDEANLNVINHLVNHSEYINTLFDAFKLFKLRNCAIEFDGKPKFINERSFAYELYRTWNATKPEDLVVNAEVTKIVNKDFEAKAIEIFGKEKYRFYPDIVLHSSQHDSEHQEMICEIKTLSNLSKESLEKDLGKLLAYTTKGGCIVHEFKTGVFILVNGDSKDIANYLSEESIGLLSNSKILFISIQITDWEILPELKTVHKLMQIRHNLNQQ